MGDEFALISLIGTIIITAAAVAIVLVAAGYIFSSIGLFSMAKKRGLAKKAFLAWIPYGRLYLMGLLARDAGLHMATQTHRHMHILLPSACIAEDVLIVIFANLHIAALCCLSYWHFPHCILSASMEC